jgi:acetyl-CoA acyltransferase 1
MASSQSSLDESYPVEVPATPQPLDASLPDTQDIHRAISPITSMAVGGGSEGNEKIGSPTAISASMTPPPSTQAPDPRLPNNTRRTATSSAVLSSPPPTVPNGIKREVPNGTTIPRPILEQLNTATETELREMVKSLVVENEKLELGASEGRMSAAHYKLQYNLLSMETEETAKRMEVEHEMTRREVAYLQYANQGRDSTPAGKEYVARLKSFAQLMEQENIALDHKLQKAKKMIEMKNEELQEAKDDKARLLQRIRENREHMNVLRSPGGIFHVATPKVSHQSYPATPQQYRGTPKHTPMTGRSINREHSTEPFAALLLAGNVLSQENNNSAPSTPIVNRRSDPRTPVNRHNRGVQSLSSLPTTPGSARPATANSTLLPSVQFTPRSRVAARTPVHQSRERRRKSRDSTISASDAEEIARAVMASYREESEEILESQASQSATEMLRIDPRESFEVAASTTSTPTPSAERNNLHQSKIFGSVSKPAAEKRKRLPDSYDEEYAAKKVRAAVEGIGLGIGL